MKSAKSMRKTNLWQAYFILVSVLFSQFSFLNAKAQEIAKIGVVFNSFDCVFTRSLVFGARGEDVSCLQKYLGLSGYFAFAGGPTGYFGSITRQAVAKWQANNGIMPSAGYFGPISMAKYRVLIALSPKAEASFGQKTTENIEKTQNNAKTDIADVSVFGIQTPSSLINVPKVVSLERKGLTLPTVQDSEIIIDSNGVSTAEDYFRYFATNVKDVVFDGRKFAPVLTGENKIPLFVPELIRKALNEGDFSIIQSSLAVQKEFLEAKIAYTKPIKVVGEAIAVHKKNIAFDMLTMKLIGMAQGVPSGSFTKQEVSDFYIKYEALAKNEHFAVRKKIDASLSEHEEKNNLVLSVLEKFLLPYNAYAQIGFFNPFNFGDKVAFFIPCLCSFGVMVWLQGDLPKPKSRTSDDDRLYVSFLLMLSPILFGFHSWYSFRPGAWWLGTYFPIEHPCIVFIPIPPSCVRVGEADIAGHVGTSS